jgi:Gpi18-like mannosyltransferase
MAAMRTFSPQTRLTIQVGISVAVIYALLWTNHASPDLRDYLFPWLAHIRSFGPVQAFSEPFSNYAPPYLYLLSLTSLLSLSPLATIKLLSVAGTLVLGLAVSRLAGRDAGLVVLLLPTVVLNGPMLGQCDAIWSACCVMAVAMALERRTYAMALWAGVGFAFKAQAAFIAPFAFLVVVNERKPLAVAIPIAVYLVAIMPAWLAGWPLHDLLTVYARQFTFPILGNAPNIWAIPAALLERPSTVLYVLGYAAAALGIAIYVWRRPVPTVAAALLSAILPPFLLPKMHERFFFLADALSLCMVFMHPRTFPVFVAVQAGSLLSYISYGTAVPFLNILGACSMAFALWKTVDFVRSLKWQASPANSETMPPAPSATRGGGSGRPPVPRP